MFNKYVVILVFLLFSISIANSQEFPQYTTLYVNDFSGILDDFQKQALVDLFNRIKSETTAEVVFVSMNTIGSNDISQYATELGQNWGVGNKGNDNGLVILYVKDIQKLYVAVGYGLEGILPDSKVGRILDETYVPLRDSGNVSEGIVLASKKFSQVILDNKKEVISGKTGLNKKYSIIIIIIGWVFFIIIISYLSSKNKYSVFPTINSYGGFKIGGMSRGSFGGGKFGGAGAGR